MYGSGGQALGASFYAWYDFSYLMMLYSPAEWKNLYTGQTAWTDPAIKAQIEKWVSLFIQGLHQPGRADQHRTPTRSSGRQGRHDDGGHVVDRRASSRRWATTWGCSCRRSSTSRSRAWSSTRGDGFSMTTYSQHQAQAAAFLAFLASDEAQPIVAQAG